MFQPTLPHGERHLSERWCEGRHSFNPRSRMGSDMSWIAVSSLSHRFNPRSRMGSDKQVSIPEGGTRMFQPTLPHGERLSPSIFLIFN